jgi:hypothetical protein
MWRGRLLFVESSIDGNRCESDIRSSRISGPHVDGGKGETRPREHQLYGAGKHLVPPDPRYEDIVPVRALPNSRSG